MNNSRLLTLTIVLLTTFISAPTHAEETDFRTLQAPATVQIVESPKLMEQLQLSDQQAEQIDQRLSEWKADYRRKQAEHDSLPPDDKSRRGFPPTRDRQLHTDMREILNPEQQQTYDAFDFSWQFGPLGRRGSSLRFDETLSLSSKQHRALHGLQIDWVRSAFPAVKAIERASPRGNITAYQKLAVMSWQYKPQRDRCWEQILTAEQARRWKELELQMVLWQEPRLLVLDYTQRAQGEVLVAGAFLDSQVPYFEPPAIALDLSEEQLAKMNAIYEQFEQDAKQFQRPEARQEWEAYFTRYLAMKREAMQQLEAVMTDGQRKQWRGMLGELTESSQRLIP